MSDPDADLEGMSREELLGVARQLRQAIRQHRDATGHNLCWWVPELWDLLPDKVVPNPQIPPREEFMQCCALYRTSLDEKP